MSSGGDAPSPPSSSEPPPRPPNEEPSPTRLGSLLWRAVLLNALVVVEAAAGLLLLVVVLRGEGFSATSDALFAAWTIPQILGRGLFVTFTSSAMGYLLGSSPEEYRGRGGQLLQLAAALGGGLSLLLALTSGLWVPGALLGADPATRVQALSFARWTVWLCLWAALADAHRSLLYGSERLVWPSVARLLGTASQVGGAFLAVGAGWPEGVAASVGLGPLVEVLVGAAAVVRDAKIRPRFSWLDRATVREVFRVNGLPLMGRLSEVPARLLEQSLTSYLPPGTLAGVQVARRVASSISNFVFRGLTTTTLLPGALAGEQRAKDLFRVGVCIGAAVLGGLLVYGTALGRVLFEYGKVTGEGIGVVAHYLRYLAVALFLGGVNRVHYSYLVAGKAGGVLFWLHASGNLVLCLAAPVLFQVLPGLDALGLAQTLGAVAAFGIGWRAGRRVDETGVLLHLGLAPVVVTGTTVLALAALARPVVLLVAAPLGALAVVGELALGGLVTLAAAGGSYLVWGRLQKPRSTMGPL